jgi:tRNA dimethylallyltransferase
MTGKAAAVPSLAELPPHIWVLAGPTASGKTQVALELAARLVDTVPGTAGAAGVEILSADARQIYRGMRIGAAQPTAAEGARVPHHLVDCVDPLTLYTAADFGRDGRRVLASLSGRGVVPLVVGGSGLYLRVLIEGLFEGPPRHAALRAELEARAERQGDAALHAELARSDPETAARLHARDRVRVIRALEVLRLTGVPLSEHHRRHSRAGSLAARTRLVVLDRERADLHARIARRTAAMYRQGILDEAARLLARGLAPEHPAYRTIGYREAFDVVRGRCSVEAAIEATTVATRQYARRQLIWLRGWTRHLPAAPWVVAPPDELPERTAARILVRLAGSAAGGGAGRAGDA